MDQFRGYTVLGMFIVNYLGHFDNVYHTLLHNDYYFSYADTIMPAFIFAVGFSFRLTILKRLPEWGWGKTLLSYIKRSLALILVSVAIFGIGNSFGRFEEFYYNPNVMLDGREYQQVMKTDASDLNESDLKGKFRDTLIQGAQFKLPEGESLSEAQLASIEEQVDQQYAMLMESHTEYQNYKDYLEAKEDLENQEEIQDRIDAGVVTEDQLRPNERELLEKEITLPAYTSAPYFWSHIADVAALVLKSDLWETLAVIGVTQLVVLPFIAIPFWGRFGVMVGMGLFHAWITHVFNWQFMFGYTEDSHYINLSHGLNNWMGEIWGTGRNRSWDGGVFGVFAWAVIMLAGSLSYDIMKGETPKSNAVSLSIWGGCFVVIAYLLTCMSNFYDLPIIIEQENKEIIEANNFYSSPEEKEMPVERFLSTLDEGKRAEVEALLIEPAEESQVQSGNARGKAASPVVPPFSQLGSRPLSSLFAPLPFMKNDPYELQNYWLIWKRVVTLPFCLFSAGFAFLVLALFVVLCDMYGLRVGVFRTFGMNPLAAYAIHEVVLHSLLPASLPEDSDPWLIVCSLLLFLLIVWGMVRSLEKQNIYVRM
ncbi:MAG: hypothetical protein CMJ46_06995 [Planctomyces sp.]|nr:hypothetical protein [Planctomyces sp.]